jgi:hypothetical protein
MSDPIERLVKLLKQDVEKNIANNTVSAKAASEFGSSDNKLEETDLETKAGYQRVVYQYTLYGTTTITANSVLCVLGTLNNEGTINNEGTLVVGGVMCP